MATNKIFITGFMGSGKSTVGKKLAKKLGYNFIDTDDVLESKFHKEIRHIFADEGEDWFRKQEEKEIFQISKIEGNTIISLGGGALMSGKTLKRIKSLGILIYIKSSPENIYNRIKHSTRRPLLRSEGENLSREQYMEKIDGLLSVRETGFLAADIIYDRDGQDASDCAEKIKYLIKNEHIQF